MIPDSEFQKHVKDFYSYSIGKKVFKVFAFTWSPDEKKYDIEHVKSRMDDQCSYNSVYYLYPEYRDYDCRTGLHYHGIIICYDWRKWNSRYHNSFKTYQIKPLLEFHFREEEKYLNRVTLVQEHGLKGWINYCTKECCLNDNKCLSNLRTNVLLNYV